MSDNHLGNKPMCITCLIFSTELCSSNYMGCIKSIRILVKQEVFPNATELSCDKLWEYILTN